MRSGAILAALAILPTGVSAAEPDYSIAAIDYAPTPLQQVGSVKAGLACLPKGKLKWRDVAQPEARALIKRVEAKLSEGGLRVAPQPDALYGDAPPLTAYRIRVTVTDMQLRLCVPGDVMFVGKVGRKPVSEGSITVRWETFDRVARVRMNDVRFDIPVDDHDGDARTASHVLSNAVEESAVRYAATRQKGGH